MEKLELRNLAGYLEHGLKCQRIPISDLWDEKIVELTALDVADKIAIFHKSADYYFDDEEKEFNIKPLVIPLSQLTKEEWQQVFDVGLQYFHIADLTIDERAVIAKYKYPKQQIKFLMRETYFTHGCYFNQLAAFEKLYSLHADLHGLIDAGLGLNKLETLNKEI